MYIEEERKAEDYLDNIGYYRLSAYMYPLLKTPKTAHVFKNDATFTKVMMLYRFDKKLRLLMFNEIEKIDNAKFNETMRAISGEYAKSKEEFMCEPRYLSNVLTSQ